MNGVQTVLMAFAGGLAAAVAVVFGFGLIDDHRRRRMEERRQRGELPANDNFRPSPAERQRAREIAAEHMAERLLRNDEQRRG